MSVYKNIVSPHIRESGALFQIYPRATAISKIGDRGQRLHAMHSFTRELYTFPLTNLNSVLLN